jgi:hypothetical protein
MEDQVLVEMNGVVSNNIAQIGYNKEHKLLRVRFKNGGHYEYRGVPEHVYDAFKTALSAGKYFSTVIRNKFACKKLEN